MTDNLVQYEELDDIFASRRLWNKYTAFERMGFGSFGTVYRGFQRSNYKIVAIKIYKEKNEDVTVPDEVLLHEIASSGSDLVIKLVDWFLDSQSQVAIVMDTTATTIDLVKFLKVRPPRIQVYFVFWKVIRALKRLHEDGIVHRDIKLSNILIDPVMQKVQLCDFGSAALDQVEDFTEVSGVICNSPPEWFATGRYNGRKMDAWGAGRILFSLVTGRDPFMNLEDVINYNISWERFNGFPCTLQAMCARLLAPDPKNRLDVSTALEVGVNKRFEWL